MKALLSKLAAVVIALGISYGLGAQCNASFVYSVSSTTVTFTSTSTGTTSNTSHMWFFGDGNPGISTATTGSVSYVYPYNGTYTAWMSISDSTCMDSTSQSITITSGITCPLASSFSFSYGTGGNVNFYTTSTGTTSSTAYLWNFGGLATSTVANATYNFPANGTYTVSLQVYDSNYPYMCSSTSVQTVVVTGAPSCPLGASFTYTIGTGGNVTVTSTATGTNSNTWVYWNFGDGTPSTIGMTASHSYSTTGGFYIYMQVVDTTNTACWDSTSQWITIGSACPVNSSFYIWKDSSVAGLWHAVPNYPANTSGVLWSWGDGSSSSSMYPTHTYSATGYYNICLTVSVSCGTSSTTCLYSNIYKPAGNLSFAGIQVDNVTGIHSQAADPGLSVNIYPNPGNGNFKLDAKGFSANDVLSVHVLNILGSTVYSAEKNSQDKSLNLDALPDGTYFIKCYGKEKTFTSRIVITR